MHSRHGNREALPFGALRMLAAGGVMALGDEGQA